MKSQAQTKYKTKEYNGGNIRETEYGTYQADVRVDGKRYRKQFDDLDKAKAFIDEQLGGGEEVSKNKYAYLSQGSRASDAVTALKLLEQAGKTDSLCSIVKAFLERNQGAGSDILIKDMFKAHIDDLKARRRKRTWVDKENRLKPFSELFGGLKLSEITFQDVSEWLESTGHEGRNLRNDQIAIQSFFNWCDKHTERMARESGNLSMHWHNDVAVFPSSDWETSDAPEVGTVSNTEALKVLHALENKDPQSALVMALGLLAGLRTSEIVDKDGLLWENIDFEEKEITVTAKQSKTKHGRTVSINPALLTWLLKYKKESGRIGRRFNAFRKYRKEACEGVGVTWPHNGARHTFASNYCKIHGETKTADALGHVGSVDMLLDHYRGVMQSKAKAKAYFEILIPADAGKDVIQISHAG